MGAKLGGIKQINGIVILANIEVPDSEEGFSEAVDWLICLDIR